MSWWKSRSEQQHTRVNEEVRDMVVSSMAEPLPPERFYECADLELARSEINALQLVMFLYLVQTQVAAGSQRLASVISQATVEAISTNRAFADRFRKVEVVYGPMIGPCVAAVAGGRDNALQLSGQIFLVFCERTGGNQGIDKMLSFAFWLRIKLNSFGSVVDMLANRYPL